MGSHVTSMARRQLFVGAVLVVLLVVAEAHSVTTTTSIAQSIKHVADALEALQPSDTHTDRSAWANTLAQALQLKLQSQATHEASLPSNDESTPESANAVRMLIGQLIICVVFTLSMLAIVDALSVLFKKRKKQLDVTVPIVIGERSSVQQGSRTTKSTARITFFAAEGFENRIKHFACKFQQASFEMCDSPIVIENVLPGEHSLAIKAMDEDLDKIGKTLTLTWTVTTHESVGSPEEIGSESDNWLRAVGSALLSPTLTVPKVVDGSHTRLDSAVGEADNSKVLEPSSKLAALKPIALPNSQTEHQQDVKPSRDRTILHDKMSELDLIRATPNQMRDALAHSLIGQAFRDEEIDAMSGEAIRKTFRMREIAPAAVNPECARRAVSSTDGCDDGVVVEAWPKPVYTGHEQATDDELLDKANNNNAEDNTDKK